MTIMAAAARTVRAWKGQSLLPDDNCTISWMTATTAKMEVPIVMNVFCAGENGPTPRILQSFARAKHGQATPKQRVLPGQPCRRPPRQLLDSSWPRQTSQRSTHLEQSTRVPAAKRMFQTRSLHCLNCLAPRGFSSSDVREISLSANGVARRDVGDLGSHARCGWYSSTLWFIARRVLPSK